MRRGYAAPVAKSTPFDNSSNGFTAKDVQSAIEEAATTGNATPKLRHVMLSNGIWYESVLLYEADYTTGTVEFLTEVTI